MIWDLHGIAEVVTAVAALVAAVGAWLGHRESRDARQTIHQIRNSMTAVQQPQLQQSPQIIMNFATSGQGAVTPAFQQEQQVQEQQLPEQGRQTEPPAEQ